MALDVATGNVDSETLDVTPQRFGRVNQRLALSPHRRLYTVAGGHDHSFGGTTIHGNELIGGKRESHDLGPRLYPGEFLFVEDSERTATEDDGFLVGLVHDDGPHTSLVVLDAADVRGLPWPPLVHGFLCSVTTKWSTK